MSVLSAKMYSIGHSLVNCKRQCDGILCNQSKGIVPRCLILEDEKRKGKNGCVIIGINPGNSSKKERNEYLKKGVTYVSIINYWTTEIFEYRYYKYLRVLINTINLNGPILWTELAKCENRKKGELPPLQTFRTCVNIFLNEELKIVPATWPLLAVGRETYKALSYIYSSKTIIGIPHPTSSRGHFQKMLKKIPLKNHFSPNKNLFFENYHGIAVWLPDLLK